MSRGQQFTTFVSRLKNCADTLNNEEAKKIIQEGKLILRFPQLLPRDQIAVVQSFEKLRLGNQALWEAIAGTFHQSLERKSLFDIAVMSDILGKNLKTSEIKWSAIENRVLKGNRSEIIYDMHVVNIHCTLASHKKGSDNFWNSTETLCIEALTNNFKSEANPVALNFQLTKLIWAYTTKGKGSQEFWKQVAKLSSDLIEHHSSKTFSRMISSASMTKMLPDSLKQELMKRAAFFICDNFITTLEFNYIATGMMNIDVQRTPAVTSSIVEALISRFKSMSGWNKPGINHLFKLVYELIEVRGLAKEEKILLEAQLTRIFNLMTDPNVLEDLPDRSLLYIATLPNLSEATLKLIQDTIETRKVSLEAQLSQNPGDYQLIMDYIKVSHTQDFNIESKIVAAQLAKEDVIWNKLSICLAKFEMSKTQRSSISFNEELASACKEILNEYLGEVSSGVLPPPEPTYAASKLFLEYLDGSSSVRQYLHRAAKTRPDLQLPQVSDLCCQILTILYLRHQEDVGSIVENFVLNNQHLLVSSPYLFCAVAAVAKSVSAKDKATLIRHLDSNFEQLDPLVLANTLVFFKEVTEGHKVTSSLFTADAEEAKGKVKQMLAQTQNYLSSGSWSTEAAEVFKFKAAVQEISITETKTQKVDKSTPLESDQKGQLGQEFNGPSSKVAAEPSFIDLLGAYLESKYLPDQDLPPRVSTPIIKAENKADSGLKPMQKRVTTKPKKTQSQKDLIFTESSKVSKAEMTDFEMIRIRK